MKLYFRFNVHLFSMISTGSILFITVLFTASCSLENKNWISDNQNYGIVGGVDATPKDLVSKSTVLIYNTDKKSICSGSLIQNNIILTAAHCIGTDPTKLLLLFSLSTKVPDYSSVRKVIGAYVHPDYFKNYNQKTNQYDIALLKYEGMTPVNYLPANILTQNQYLQNKALVLVAGYGVSNGVTKQGAGTLRQSVTNIENINHSLSEALLNQKNGKGACNGDSGGPAFISINGQIFLWGVFLGGAHQPDNCNNESIVTKISFHYKWIAESTKQLILRGGYNYIPARLNNVNIWYNSKL